MKNSAIYLLSGMDKKLFSMVLVPFLIIYSYLKMHKKTKIYDVGRNNKHLNTQNNANQFHLYMFSACKVAKVINDCYYMLSIPAELGFFLFSITHEHKLNL